MMQLKVKLKINIGILQKNGIQIRKKAPTLKRKWHKLIQPMKFYQIQNEEKCMISIFLNNLILIQYVNNIHS